MRAVQRGNVFKQKGCHCLQSVRQRKLFVQRCYLVRELRARPKYAVQFIQQRDTVHAYVCGRLKVRVPNLRLSCAKTQNLMVYGM